jgi:hypothetical protein
VVSGPWVRRARTARLAVGGSVAVGSVTRAIDRRYRRWKSCRDTTARRPASRRALGPLNASAASVSTGWELPGDRLDDLGRQGDLAHAGDAFGGLEAAAILAGLVAGLRDLDPRVLGAVEVDHAVARQPNQFADAQAVPSRVMTWSHQNRVSRRAAGRLPRA